MTELFVAVVSADGHAAEARHQQSPSFVNDNVLPVGGALPLTTTWLSTGHAVLINGLYQRDLNRPLFRGHRTDEGDRYGGLGDYMLSRAVKYTRQDGPNSGGESGWSGTPCIMVGAAVGPVRYTRDPGARPYANCHSINWLYSSGEDAEILLMQAAVESVHDAWESAVHARWLAENLATRRPTSANRSAAIAARAAETAARAAAFNRDQITGEAIGSVVLYCDEISQRAADFIASAM